MQIERTGYAFSRLKEQNLYLEAKILGEGNQCIRDLLLSKGHLIPPELLDDAGALIKHYDRWLEEFDRIRASQRPSLQEKFVFVGIGLNPVPFPRNSADKFQKHFLALWLELYGT